MTPADWRKHRGLSLAKLAKELGVEGTNPARTLQRWENGERRPPIEIIAKYEAASGGQVALCAWTALAAAARADAQCGALSS